MVMSVAVVVQRALGPRPTLQDGASLAGIFSDLGRDANEMPERRRRVRPSRPRADSSTVAILAALVALGSRFATKILTTALGWASTLLFGRVPASRQILLLGVTFGSVIWMVLVAGVLVPQVGTFLLFLIPPQDIVPEGVVRLGMLIGALVLPAVIGGLTLALSPEQERGARAALEAVLRGYPLTVLLAVLLVFLAGLAIWRKVGALVRHWDDAHVPLVVKPGAYEQVATDLRRAVVDAGLEVESRPASAAMSKPAKWIAAVGGRSSSSLVPDRMLQLRGKDIDILIYPMDLLISGKPELLARARAAMASRLTTTAAHLTVSAESQAIEDRLTALATAARRRPNDRSSTTTRPRPSRRSTGRSPRSSSLRRVGGPVPPAAPGRARPAGWGDGRRGDHRGGDARHRGDPVHRREGPPRRRRPRPGRGHRRTHDEGARPAGGDRDPPRGPGRCDGGQRGQLPRPGWSPPATVAAGASRRGRRCPRGRDHLRLVGYAVARPEWRNR